MSLVLDRLASSLPAELRANADEALRLSGSEEAAHVWKEAARRVHEAIQQARMAPLTLDEAADESGYSRSQLRRHLREGKLPNSGSRSEPRILRHHLPRKPGHGVDAGRPTAACSPTQAARAVIKGGA